jgi:predicted SAM-dependent methyltransferase
MFVCEKRLKTMKKVKYNRKNGNDMKLDFGCGNKCKKGFLGVDIRKLDGVKFVCNSWEIDKYIEINSVSNVFSRHFLEHLTFHQSDLTLKVWSDILKINGIVEIIVPDLDYHINQFCNMDWNSPSELSSRCRTIDHALAGFWGWQKGKINDCWDIHKSGYNFDLLKTKLAKHNFRDIQRTKDKSWNLRIIAKK